MATWLTIMSEQSLEELASFLLPHDRLDVKCTAVEYVLGLSNSESGRNLIRSSRDVVDRIFDLMADKDGVISKKAHLVIVNLSSDQNLEDELVRFVPQFLHHLQDPQWVHADQLCAILTNLSRTTTGAKSVMSTLTKGMYVGTEENPPYSTPTLYEVVDIFDRRTSFNSWAEFHYLASMFLNLSQLAEARLLFLDHSKCLLPRLLPYTQFHDSSIRRGGIVGLCKNLCFEIGWSCIFSFSEV